MNSSNVAVAIIGASMVVGLILGISAQLPVDTALELADISSGKDSLEYGSAHGHALFYVVVNGSELDFSGGVYQLNSRYVHLENNRSHIVHKHAEGVSWQRFLDTINVSTAVNRSSVCVETLEKSYCGGGELYLNGMPDPDLDTEIGQGDNLVIAIGRNASKTVDSYLKRQLPPAYKPAGSRGYRT